MRPSGWGGLISAMGAVQGSTTEKTFCSRMRRAISCVYCEPKSRMTIVWVATLQVWQGASSDCKRGPLFSLCIEPHRPPQVLDGFGRTFTEFYLAERFQQPLGIFRCRQQVRAFL